MKLEDVTPQTIYRALVDALGEENVSFGTASSRGVVNVASATQVRPWAFGGHPVVVVAVVGGGIHEFGSRIGRVLRRRGLRHMTRSQMYARHYYTPAAETTDAVLPWLHAVGEFTLGGGVASTRRELSQALVGPVAELLADGLASCSLEGIESVTRPCWRTHHVVDHLPHADGGNLRFDIDEARRIAQELPRNLLAGARPQELRGDGDIRIRCLYEQYNGTGSLEVTAMRPGLRIVRRATA